MSPAKKPRKALDDALAAEFVYGATESKNQRSEKAPLDIDETQQVDEPIETEAEKASQKQERGSLMSRLMEVPEKEATVRITVDLPQSMHQKLSMFSARTGKKKAEIIRMLLDDILNDVSQ
jgi:hypothetical protein